MNTLTLSIKQKFFDQILAGAKKEEFREIRPNNAKKYFKYSLNGKLYDSEEELPSEDEEAGDIDLIPVNYDAIKFLTGEYKGKRPFAIVKVEDARIELLTDEDGNDLVYEHEGKEYIMAQVVYSLGEIIEQSNY